MSVTCPVDPTKPYIDPVETPRADLAHDEPFVPVYARRGKARGGQRKIRTWMILTPVAAIVLGGIGAMLVLNSGEEAPLPLAEPAATTQVLSAMPATSEVAVAPLDDDSPPVPVVATPRVSDPAPPRRIAPAPAPAVTPAPEPSAGPQPYAASPAEPSTAPLNTAPATAAPTPAQTPPPPVIIVEPMG